MCIPGLIPKKFRDLSAEVERLAEDGNVDLKACLVALLGLAARFRILREFKLRATHSISGVDMRKGKGISHDGEDVRGLICHVVDFLGAFGALGIP